MFDPFTSMRPDVGSMSRLIIFIVVVLPQPEGPTRTTVSPSSMSNDRPETAGGPEPNRFTTSTSEIIARPLPHPLVFRSEDQASRCVPLLECKLYAAHDVRDHVVEECEEQVDQRTNDHQAQSDEERPPLDQAQADVDVLPQNHALSEVLERLEQSSGVYEAVDHCDEDQPQDEEDAIEDQRNLENAERLDVLDRSLDPTGPHPAGTSSCCCSGAPVHLRGAPTGCRRHDAAEEPRSPLPSLQRWPLPCGAERVVATRSRMGVERLEHRIGGRWLRNQTRGVRRKSWSPDRYAISQTRLPCPLP